MQLPFGPNPTVDKRREARERREAMPGGVFVQPGQVLSIESQLKLRELFEFIDTSRAALNDIRRDLSFFPSPSKDSCNLQKISVQLGHFCTEADNWGFDALYQVGLRLQMALLNCSGRLHEDILWNTLNRALAMLLTLLDQCESDFRWRLAIADMLDSLDQLSRN
jgi:hypothetical protein